MNLKNVGADSISARQRGITLIALVVTLIVLLILSGITLNVVLSEGGIIAKAQSSKEKQEVAVWLDRLTVAEANTAVTNYAVDMEKYNNQLKAEGIVQPDDSNYELNIEDESYDLTTKEGYIFNVSEPTPGDIVINYKGKKGELPPSIIGLESIQVTSNSIKVQTKVKDLEEGKITYYYKKQTEVEYVEHVTTTELTSEFIELTQDETYDIKAIAENKNGKSKEKIIHVLTGELLEGTISQKGPTVWSNGKASIELQTTDTVNTMQYQKNDITGSWTNYTGAIGNLEYKDRIYARMWDGTNGNNPYSVEILDNVAPEITEVNNSTTSNTILLTVTAVDNESGMETNPTYIFYKKLAIEPDSSYIKEQESTNNSYTSKQELLQNTSYTIKVEVKDKVNNIGIYEKNLTTKQVEDATDDLQTGNIIASTPIWNTGKASMTLSTTTGMQIEWQKNGINGIWIKGTNLTGLLDEDIIYARLSDGVNVGGEASYTIIGSTPVMVSTSTVSKTTNTINVQTKATDVNGDNLTYQLYTGTSASGPFTLKATSASTAQNQVVNLTVSGLSEYTNYYYYIAVTDGKRGTQDANKTSIRTYCTGTAYSCSANSCNGSSYCYTCSGTGRVVNSNSCGAGRSGGRKDCPKCNFPGWTSICDTCYAVVEIGCNNYSCGYNERFPHATRYETCYSCSGSGTIRSCSHGYSSSHYYCSHYNNTGSGSHRYCAHNYNGTQHD